ncbi:MAG: hypothetical protein ACM3O3_01605 [Syntrophothermus sp.]
MINLFVSISNAFVEYFDDLDYQRFLTEIYEILRFPAVQSVNTLYIYNQNKSVFLKNLMNFTPIIEDEKTLKILKNPIIISSKKDVIKIIENIKNHQNYFIANFYTYKFNPIIKSKEVRSTIVRVDDEFFDNVLLPKKVKIQEKIKYVDQFIEIIEANKKLAKDLVSLRVLNKFIPFMVNDPKKHGFEVDKSISKAFFKLENTFENFIENHESLGYEYSKITEYIVQHPEFKEIQKTSFPDFLESVLNPKTSLYKSFEKRFKEDNVNLKDYIEIPEFKEFVRKEAMIEEEKYDSGINLSEYNYNVLRFIPNHLFEILNPSNKRKFELIKENKLGVIIIISKDTDFVEELVQDASGDKANSFYYYQRYFLPSAKISLQKEFDLLSETQRSNLINDIKNNNYESTIIIHIKSKNFNIPPDLRNIIIAEIEVPPLKKLSDNFNEIVLFYLNKKEKFTDNLENFYSILAIKANYFDIIYKNFKNINQFRALLEVEDPSLLDPIYWYEIFAKALTPTYSEKEIYNDYIQQVDLSDWQINYCGANYRILTSEGFNYYMYLLEKLQNRQKIIYSAFNLYKNMQLFLYGKYTEPDTSPAQLIRQRMKDVLPKITVYEEEKGIKERFSEEIKKIKITTSKENKGNMIVLEIENNWKIPISAFPRMLK